MANDTRYNGWRNFETWNVALWLDNEQDTYTECTDKAEKVARYHFDDSTDTIATDSAINELAGWLKDYVEAMQPDLGASCFADLLNAAMGEVDWREVADHYLSEPFLDIAKEVEGEGRTMTEVDA